MVLGVFTEVGYFLLPCLGLRVLDTGIFVFETAFHRVPPQCLDAVLNQFYEALQVHWE